MRTLQLQSLAPFSLSDPKADHAAFADPTAAPPAWLITHQDTATNVLGRVRQGTVPAHAPVVAPLGPARHQDAHALVKQRLALLPPWAGRSGAGAMPVAPGVAGAARLRQGASPGVPELVIMCPPTEDYKPLVEFMLLLQGLNARHVVVLGDLARRWAKDRNDTPSMYTMVHGDSSVGCISSGPTRSGAGWRRDVTLEWEHPSVDDPETSVCNQHKFQQMQVECGTPGVLGPTQLRCAADWILWNHQPGDRVVLLGRDDRGVSATPGADPLLAMSGQLALTLALRQGLAATAGPSPETADAFHRHQQRQWLQDAASDLHQRDPALLGDAVHLAAALAASAPVAEASRAPVHSSAA